jgi:hypothetical protein
LVTTGDPNGVNPGALNDPTTHVLLGDQNLNYGTVSGLRATVGGWLCASETFGLEGSGFVLARRATHFTAMSSANDQPFLAIPINNAVPIALPGGGTLPAGEVGFPHSVPGVATGISSYSSSSLWGAEADGLVKLYHGPQFHADLLAGFRYLDLLEKLGLTFSGTVPGLPGVASLDDAFQTRNQFYGAQIGVQSGYCCGKFTFDVAAKVAFGSTFERVGVAGTKTVTATGLGAFTLTAPGGIFAEPSNIGQQTNNVFSVLPEVSLQAGFRVTEHLRAFIGYDFLFISDVVRPGNQIDRTINLTQLSGFPPAVPPARPMPLMHGSDFWAQGVTLGLELRF